MRKELSQVFVFEKLQEQGREQKELAKFLGISPQRLSNLKLGYAVWTEREMALAAEFLGCNVDDIFLPLVYTEVIEVF